MPIALGPLLHSIVDSEIDAFERYLDVVVSKLASEAEALTTRLSEQAALLSPDQADDLFEFFSDDHYELSERFPRLFLNSIFVTLVSMTEHELMRLTKHVERRVAVTIGNFSKPKNKSTIAAMADYMSKMPGLSFPHQSPSWTAVQTYNRVRNAIVHQYGEAGSDTHPDAKAFLIGRSAISSNGRTILLTSAICEQSIRDTRRFFEELTQGLPPGLSI